MKVWSQVPAGEINAANQRLWVAMGKSADKIAARINTDPAFVANIARFMVNVVSSTSQKDARVIMGKNFFGVEEAIEHFGVNPTEKQLVALSEVPFSKKILESCKDTHVLVAVFPLSIFDIHDIVSHALFLSCDSKQEFVMDKGEVDWQLVRKGPIIGFLNRMWNEQEALLSKVEEVPKAQVMVYTIIGHFLASRERLFKNTSVRCSDLDPDDNHVVVGNFDDAGLLIVGCFNYHCADNLGLATVVKQQVNS